MTGRISNYIELTRKRKFGVISSSLGINLVITPESGWVQSATYEDLSGTVTVGGTKTITDVEYDVDGGGYASVDTFAGGPAWSQSSIALAEGPNVITVKATDSDANEKTASITISVDTIDPVVDLGPDTTHDGTGNFTITSSMWVEANPALVEYQVNGGGYITWVSPYNDVVIPTTSEIDYTIDLRVTDLSGRAGSDQIVISYAEAFNPIDVSPVQWIDPSDANLLYVDAGTTNVSADGDAVYQANDKTTNANNVTQTTAAKRLAYKTGQINSLSVLRSDGSDDFMSASYTLNQPYERWIVFKPLSFTSGDRMIDGVSSGTRGLITQTGTEPTIGLYAGSTTLPTNNGATTGNAHIGRFVFNGASSSITIDNGTPTIGNPGTHNAGGITIAANFDGSSCGEFDFGDIITVPGTVSAENVTNMWAWLNAKWGVY